jgi:hypothetical protein
MPISGLPYERQLRLQIPTDPTLIELSVPPRGYIHQLVMKQVTGADAFTLDIYTADPVVSASATVIDRDIFKKLSITAVGGLINEDELATPYSLNTLNEVGRVIPILYLDIGGVGAPDEIDLGITIIQPDSRA